jgi:hypothetical protein
MNLYTEKGLMHLNMIDLTMRIMKNKSLPGVGPYMINTLMESVLNLGAVAGNVKKMVLGDLKRKQSHIGFIRSFYDFLDGSAPNPVTAEDGIDVMRILESVKDRMD